MSVPTKFESAKVPAHLALFASMFGNNDALGQSGPTYPVLKIKGKVWSITEDKANIKILDDEGQPLPTVRTIVVRANPHLSKVFYKDTYSDDDSAGQAPDCSSNGGIAPDAHIAAPQAKTCAVCPHNVWGSGKEGKGKSCADSRRIAVVAEDALDKPMLLRVPAASLKPLSEYGTLLAKKGVPYQAVITRLSFDPEQSSPKLVFRPMGFLSEGQLQAISALQEDDVVKAICGMNDDIKEALEEEVAPVVKAKPKAVAAVVEEEEFEEEAAPVVKAKPKAAVKPKPAPVEEAADEFEDEEEAAPVVKAKPKAAEAAPKAAVRKGTEPPADLITLLDDLDFGTDD